MPWWIISSFVALFVLANAQESGRRLSQWPPEPWKNPTDNLIDIDLETERNNGIDQTWSEYEMSGSGSGMETDDEDLLGSGSGSGVGPGPEIDPPAYFTTTTTTTTTTTAKPTTLEPVSSCEQVRSASLHLSGNYVPRCNSEGYYDSLQCHGHSGLGFCWCADLSGREIPGTNRNATELPDCEGGSNLGRCVHELVIQSRKNLLGFFRPRCAGEGHYERVQCKGSMCYCVDVITGHQERGTEVYLPDSPVCEGSTTPQKGLRKNEETEHKITLFPPVKSSTTPRPETIGPIININIGGGSTPDLVDSGPEDTNESVLGAGEPMKEPSSKASMMTQPGILAAIIGGSVVVLLLAILLAMFIFYRMKKKDEGSYALDEPKKMPNYSYQRAPDKEFYA